MDARRDQLVKIIKTQGLVQFSSPIQLASGVYSKDFIDIKRALCQGEDLTLACQLILDTLAASSIEFDAAGGLTMGADQLAHGLAIIGPKKWFVIRKNTKGRGTNKQIEGTKLVSTDRVVLVDDVVTSGGSMQEAFRAIQNQSIAQTVGAVALVDRGEQARGFFEQHNVPYFPIVAYCDLGIEPVE